MYVRQIAGPGLYKNKTVSGDSIKKASVTDPSGDATYDAAGVSSASMPNLELVGSSVSVPSSKSCHPAGQECYRVAMTLSNLSLTHRRRPTPTRC
jgi:hypothetical protein